MKVKEKRFLQIPHSFLDVAGTKMKPSEQLVYIHLSRFCYANRNTAFPSQSTLAESTGLSLSTVGRAIKGLILKGAITIVSKTTNGRWLNKYKLMEWRDVDGLDDRFDLEIINKDQNHSDIETISKCDCKPSQNDRPIQSKSNKKNKNQEYELNNNKFAAEAAKPSASHEAPKEPNEAEFSGKIVPPAALQFDDAHKPFDIERFEFPNASLNEIQEKIYFWFRDYDPLNVHKHKVTLFKTKEEHRLLLIQGYSYLDTYWKEYGFGDRSLIMFMQNLGRFCAEVENMRFDEDVQWRVDNRKLLLREFIHDHGLFDVTDKQKLKELKEAMKEYSNTGREYRFDEAQCRYLSNTKTLFPYKHVLKDAQWGGAFDGHELVLLTEKAIYECLEIKDHAQSGVVSKDKIDKLMNTIIEIVINQDGTVKCVRRAF